MEGRLFRIVERVRLDRALAQRLVERADTSLRVEDVRPLAGGEISTVYELVCAGGRHVVSKIYPEAFTWRMEKEVYVYDLVRGRADVPVPAVLHADGSGRFVPRSYAVMTRLDGASLAAIGGELSDRDLASIYRQMGEYLRRLHEVAFDEFGYISVGIPDPHPDNTSYMRFQFDKKLREFSALGGDGALADQVAGYVRRHDALFAGCETAVLCHNDYHAGNILVVERDDGWHVSGIVDVENAVAGDPLVDLAKTVYYTRHDGGRDARVGLPAFLEAAGPLRDDWEQTLRLYELYHALELWDWYAAAGVEAPLAGLVRDIGELSQR